MLHETGGAIHIESSIIAFYANLKESSHLDIAFFMENLLMSWQQDFTQDHLYKANHIVLVIDIP